MVGTKNVNRHWIGPDGDRPTVAQRTIHDVKTMILVAVTYDGLFVADFLHKGETINSERYVQFLKKVNFSLSRRANPISWEEWILQHDNARPHMSLFTSFHLRNRNKAHAPAFLQS